MANFKVTGDSMQSFLKTSDKDKVMQSFVPASISLIRTGEVSPWMLGQFVDSLTLEDAKELKTNLGKMMDAVIAIIEIRKTSPFVGTMTAPTSRSTISAVSFSLHHPDSNTGMENLNRATDSISSNGLVSQLLDTQGVGESEDEDDEDDEEILEPEPEPESSYNDFMRAKTRRIRALNPNLSHREALRSAADAWKEFKRSNKS